MAVPKAKTLQEKFGFADPDLKKPEHDAMIKWLDLNIEDILMVVFSLSVRPTDVKVIWEPVVRDYRQRGEQGQMLGYIDLIATTRRNGENWRIVFEAKTSIQSLGELFRQLHMYREGTIDMIPVSNMDFVVICPDDSEAEAIQNQRFKFLKYDPAMKFDFGGV